MTIHDILGGQEEPKGDLTPSFIRTIVPVVVGFILSWLAKKGFNIEDGDLLSTWLTPILTSAYYVVVRTVERRIPAVGWLLGLAKQPGYSAQPPPAPAPTEEPTPLIVAGATPDEVQEIVDTAITSAVEKIRRSLRAK